MGKLFYGILASFIVLHVLTANAQLPKGELKKCLTRKINNESNLSVACKSKLLKVVNRGSEETKKCLLLLAKEQINFEEDDCLNTFDDFIDFTRCAKKFSTITSSCTPEDCITEKINESRLPKTCKNALKKINKGSEDIKKCSVLLAEDIIKFAESDCYNTLDGLMTIVYPFRCIEKFSTLRSSCMAPK